MQYTVLGFSQTKLIEYNLTIIDAHILRWFVDFYQTGKMVKMMDEQSGDMYCWVKYNAVLNDLPLLGITNIRVIARRFDAMCECGLIGKIVRKTAKGSYSCFRLDPEKYNELLSNPGNTQHIKHSPVKNEDEDQNNQSSVPNSPVDNGKYPESKTTALSSTVAQEIYNQSVPTVLKSTVASTIDTKNLPSVLKSTLGHEIHNKNEPTVLESTVATAPKSTVLLSNPSSNPNPFTKIPAASVYQTLIKLDPSLILDREFYPAAAEFLSINCLGEDYLHWFYHHLKDSKRIKNLAGYIFKVFFREVYVQRYRASLVGKSEKSGGQGKTKPYSCPVCGLDQEVTSGTRACKQCDTPLDPAKVDILKYKTLYQMDNETKDLYITARSRVLRSGGNVSENLKALDKQFGLVG